MESALFGQLIQLLRSLYGETQGFLDRPEETQLWYNRGYANGMVLGLRELGRGDVLPLDLILDPDGETWGQITDQALTPWGRAHAHGLEMGRSETYEVLEARC